MKVFTLLVSDKHTDPVITVYADVDKALAWIEKELPKKVWGENNPIETTPSRVHVYRATWDGSESFVELTETELIE